MRHLFLIFSCACLFAEEPLLDLEEKTQDFVLEAKRIEIPGFPYAFNPSIIRWRDFYLMSFRIIPNPAQSFTSEIGLILLDDNFAPISDPQLLLIRNPESPIPPRAEDARLLYIGEKLYVVYSDNSEPQISKGGFRVYVGILEYDGIHFQANEIECLTEFEGESRNLREKNWVPFDYGGFLLLAYSLLPHKILVPLLGSTGICAAVCSTSSEIQWPYGILRGGTPALLGLSEGEYLSFFHSSIEMASLHSDGKKVLHYFMGAYTFSSEPPFVLKRMSPEPIIGKHFYKGFTYKPYWHPVRVVFPGGFVFDENYIWVVYGRQDHETWIVKLDRKKLLDSLILVPSLLSQPVD